MRTAIISDIHGNLPALQAVLDDARTSGVTHYIFIGDYIFDMPFSNEVVRLLMTLENSYIINGNKEIALLNMAMQDQSEWIYNQMGMAYQTFRETPPNILDFLRGLPEQMLIQLTPNTKVLATHYLNNDFVKSWATTNFMSHNFHKNMLAQPFTHQQYLAEFNNWINSPEQKAVIEPINANVILFGHNHLQYHGYCGNKLVINPGSCGVPLDFDNRAAYTILEETATGLAVHERRVAYDVERIIEQAKECIAYEKGKIWCDLTFMALRTGLDYSGFMFEIAREIKLAKNESGKFYSNSTWAEANEIFMTRHGVT